MLQQTYIKQAHPITGSPQTERGARMQVTPLTTGNTHTSKGIWQLKTECEINLQTDKIIWMSKNEMRKFKRQNRKK